MSRSGLGITPGSGDNLLVEDETGGKAQVHFAHQGRLIPVAATYANSAFSVDDVTTVDLLAHAPAGATFARIMLDAAGGALSWWDDGKDPKVAGVGMVVVAGDWYDVGNLGELTHFYMLATTATAAQVRVAWYKTS